ncbi:TadE family protein [Actinomyces gerencseriae]|uniref:TadE family protein n=1 Tax=Actinomyces gerencseriae TaxID=52769 RepID=UPI0023F14F33|nr:TadE family protein [Actinomyces gerencseriae]
MSPSRIRPADPTGSAGPASPGRPASPAGLVGALAGALLGAPRRREDGSMSVEMVVLAPILLMVVLVAVAGGRYVSAEGMTQAAARDAARAASIERSAPAAQAAANETLASAQTASGDCSASTSTADFARGGSVTARVTCRVELSDLGLVFLPGATSISAQATAPVDTLRGTS